MDVRPMMIMTIFTISLFAFKIMHSDPKLPKNVKMWNFPCVLNIMMLFPKSENINFRLPLSRKRCTGRLNSRVRKVLRIRFYCLVHQSRGAGTTSRAFPFDSGRSYWPRYYWTGFIGQKPDFTLWSKKPSRVFLKILFRLAVPNWYESWRSMIVTTYFGKKQGLKFSAGSGGGSESRYFRPKKKKKNCCQRS